MASPLCFHTNVEMLLATLFPPLEDLLWQNSALLFFIFLTNRTMQDDFTCEVRPLFWLLNLSPCWGHLLQTHILVLAVRKCSAFSRFSAIDSCRHDLSPWPESDWCRCSEWACLQGKSEPFICWAVWFIHISNKLCAIIWKIIDGKHYSAHVLLQVICNLFLKCLFMMGCSLLKYSGSVCLRLHFYTLTRARTHTHACMQCSVIKQESHTTPTSATKDYQPSTHIWIYKYELKLICILICIRHKKCLSSSSHIQIVSIRERVRETWNNVSLWQKQIAFNDARLIVRCLLGTFRAYIQSELDWLQTKRTVKQWACRVCLLYRCFNPFIESAHCICAKTKSPTWLLWTLKHERNIPNKLYLNVMIWHEVNNTHVTQLLHQQSGYSNKFQ